MGRAARVTHVPQGKKVKKEARNTPEERSNTPFAHLGTMGNWASPRLMGAWGSLLETRWEVPHEDPQDL